VQGATDVADGATNTAAGAVSNVTVKCAVGNIDDPSRAADGTASRSAVVKEGATHDCDGACPLVGDSTTETRAAVTRECAVCDVKKAPLIVDRPPRRVSKTGADSPINLESAFRHVNRAGFGIKIPAPTAVICSITSDIPAKHAVGHVHRA